MYKGSTFFDSTALQANSRSLFFHAFLTIFRSFVVFFTAKIPVLMRKPPVSLLSLKIFFHADALDLESSIVAYNKKNTYNYRYA